MCILVHAGIWNWVRICGVFNVNHCLFFLKAFWGFMRICMFDCTMHSEEWLLSFFLLSFCCRCSYYPSFRLVIGCNCSHNIDVRSQVRWMLIWQMCWWCCRLCVCVCVCMVFDVELVVHFVMLAFSPSLFKFWFSKIILFFDAIWLHEAKNGETNH